MTVLSRHAGANMPGGVRLSVWDPPKGEPAADAIGDADAIVHLAGEPVAQRWSPAVKERIRESRVAGTRNLVQALAKLQRRPSVLICGSAVGYYGSRGDEMLTEERRHRVTDTWRSVAVGGEGGDGCGGAWHASGRLRTGIVLDPKGGALQRCCRPSRWALAARLAVAVSGCRGFTFRI